MAHRKSPLGAGRPQRCAREGELVFRVTRHGAMVSERGPAGQRTVLPPIEACVHLPRKTGNIEQGAHELSRDRPTNYGSRRICAISGDSIAITTQTKPAMTKRLPVRLLASVLSMRIAGPVMKQITAPTPARNISPKVPINPPPCASNNESAITFC
jgi:hypothetical protein